MAMQQDHRIRIRLDRPYAPPAKDHPVPRNDRDISQLCLPACSYRLRQRFRLRSLYVSSRMQSHFRREYPDRNADSKPDDRHSRNVNEDSAQGFHSI